MRTRNLTFGALTLAVSLAAHAACLPDGIQPSGAAYRICMPDGTWNGNLVVYAHGYVDVTQPLGIPEDQLVLPDGTSLPQLVNTLGYAFAVSGYSVNGLAVLQGIADSANLVSIFSSIEGPPAKTFIAGPSEGGLVTALSVEQYPSLYSGGLAACGPIGDFPSEINYIGNFRVIWDYFFPGVLPGNAAYVPPYVMAHWDDTYLPAILAAVKANPSATQQLLKVTKAPVTSDASTISNTIQSLLWYSVFTTGDAEIKLGGQPFDNSTTIYTGSQNDFLLNLKVERYTASPAAVNEMKAHYNATGKIARPVVTIHTTGDPIIPYWHEILYTLKTAAAGTASKRLNLPVAAYGHCNLTGPQVLASFVALTQMAK